MFVSVMAPVAAMLPLVVPGFEMDTLALAMLPLVEFPATVNPEARAKPVPVHAMLTEFTELFLQFADVIVIE